MSEVKRLDYFTSQFLIEKDFTDEQAYHVAMRRLHNRSLHTWGVVQPPGGQSGLQVSASGARAVTVSPGVAVDRDGREIVVPSDPAPASIDLSPLGANTDSYITIAYHEVEDPADRQTAGGVDHSTRITERPLIQATAAVPPNDGSVIALARLHLDANGNISGPIDNSIRPLAGASVIPRSIGATELVDGAIGDAKLDPTVRARLVTGGDSHDHVGGDGAQIRHSRLNRDDGTNPHQTTAADVQALPTAGGTLTGRLTLNRGGTAPAVTGQLTVQANEANVASASLNNVQAGPASGLVSTVVGATSSATLRTAAIVGFADVDLVAGVYARAKAGTPALFVDGAATFNGTKSGYVVDTFLNASGQQLRTGDLVRLKGSPVVRFRGQNNRIPVAEVVLADAEDDPRLIGIVDGEAIPDPDAPDNRVRPEDPTFAEDGGEVYVVTLGAYAHCKVDASESPIQVGDLLTSSTKAGYAKKATNPRIGCLIGKALEPLAEGEGYIAVFVNIL